jgi:hypothetical protein
MIANPQQNANSLYAIRTVSVSVIGAKISDQKTVTAQFPGTQVGKLLLNNARKLFSAHYRCRPT